MAEQVQGTLEVLSSTSDVTIILNGTAASLRAGTSGSAGRLDVVNAAGARVFRLEGSGPTLTLGASGSGGQLRVRDAAGRRAIQLDGKTGAIAAGTTGSQGSLVLRDAANKQRIKLNAGNGDLQVKDGAGQTILRFDNRFAALHLGGQGNEGDLIVRDGAKRERIKLDGGEGDIRVRNAAGETLFHFDSQFAALHLGGKGNEGDLVVRNGAGDQTIKLDGGQGDIILSNADAAEDFEVAHPDRIEAGAVMVLATDGRLEPCSRAYDRKVVGVVSGAGRYRPGIVLGRRAGADARRLPVSVMGKVACRADAAFGAIRVGDLLTTSPTAGRAMKASNPANASGAIIGKALSSLDQGEDLVEMLISLQ